MRSVGTRFLIPVGILAILSSALVFYQTYESSRKHAYELISQQAAMALEFNLAIRNYVAEKIRPAMEKLVDKDVFIPETMSTSFISRRIFEEVEKKFPNYIIRFASDNPRNPINKANPDDHRIIEYFRQNPQVHRRTEEIQIEGRSYLAHFTPRFMKQDCLQCHSEPKDAPAELLKRYDPTAGFHRKEGDVAGLDIVAVPVEAINAALVYEMRSRFMILASIFALLFGSIFYIFRFIVARRLVAMASHFDEIATHAESPWMTPVEVKGNDEISVVGVAFNKLVEQLRDSHASLELRVDERTEELRRAYEQLHAELSDREQAEEALRESEEKYRGLIDSTNTGYVIVDTEGKVLDANAEYVRLSGYNELKEVMGRSVLEWTAEQDRGTNAAALEQCLQIGLVKHLELDYVWRDGRSMPVEINATAISTSEGVIFLSVVRDISDRKRFEDQKAKLEAQLVQAQKMEAIGTLAGGIAHDFNNILTAIIGNISLAMLDRQMEEQGRQRLTEAEKACLQAQNLSRQLLTFAKGGTPIKKIVSMANVLRESAILVLSGSKSRCEFSIPEDLWLVEVDAGQINQVINNLMINADQALPEGGIIRIQAENSLVEAESILPILKGKYVKFAISDQGIGISPKYLDKIFDPYFTTKQKGNGLGLATAYSIIKNHSGHIQVESQLGVGTTFYIYLPATDKGVPADEPETVKMIMGQGKVLVMDDEKMVREVLGQMLSRLGYEADFASDGSQAIEKYFAARESRQPFAAVILDLTIPGGMGGKETIKELLKVDPQVKAIVSSGYSEDPIMAEFENHGFGGIIAKPYRVFELSKILQKVIVGKDH